MPRLAPGAEAVVPRTVPDVDPVVVKPMIACKMLSTGLTRLYALIAAGEITSYLDGRSRLITTSSIRRYVERRVAAHQQVAS